MTTQLPITKVIFRRFKGSGEIIALFPELAGTTAWYKDCLSYMSIGQHGAADTDIVHRTIAVSKKDWEPLAKELSQLSYRLEVIKRFQASHMAKRKATINAAERVPAD